MQINEYEYEYGRIVKIELINHKVSFI